MGVGGDIVTGLGVEVVPGSGVEEDVDDSVGLVLNTGVGGGDVEEVVGNSVELILEVVAGEGITDDEDDDPIPALTNPATESPIELFVLKQFEFTMPADSESSFAPQFE
jgi:hypothetical protein